MPLRDIAAPTAICCLSPRCLRRYFSLLRAAACQCHTPLLLPSFAVGEMLPAPLRRHVPCHDAIAYFTPLRHRGALLIHAADTMAIRYDDVTLIMSMFGGSMRTCTPAHATRARVLSLLAKRESARR